MNKLFLLICVSLVLVLPFASAYFYLPNYINPSDLLDNPWFIFTIFFAVFFGTIYISLGRVLGGTVPVLIVSAALGLGISAGMQRQWYFLEQPIMLWATLLIAALIIVTFIRFMLGGESKKRMWIILISLLLFWGLWPYFKNLIPVTSIDIVPYELISFLDETGPFVLIISICVLVVWALWGSKAYAKYKARRTAANYKGNV